MPIVIYLGWYDKTKRKEVLIMKYKVDHYRGPGKKRLFDVLVFPQPEYAWAYDCFPEESGPRVDGDQEAYRMFQIALAALIADPSKILYFPLKKETNPLGLGQTYHFVMLRSERQFRRSEWPRLHAKLDRKHWVGKYTIYYDKKKLLDYWEQFIQPFPYKRIWKGNPFYVEEIRGDTVFMVLPKNDCYDFLQSTERAFERYQDGERTGNDFWLGWIITEEIKEEYQKSKAEN